MQKSIETTGVNRDAAIEKALMQLGLERDDVSVEVLDNGKKGFLGIGATPARVRVTYEVPDEAPAPKPAEKRITKEEPRQKPDEKAEPKKKEESVAAQSRPSFSHIDPADPRLTTPHLVKAAPPREEQEKPAEKPERPQRSEGRPRRERPRREPREPREPRPPRISQPREEKPVIPVSAEAMEKVTAEAIRFISGLLEQMGIQAEVKVCEQLVADQLRLEVVGEAGHGGARPPFGRHRELPRQARREP